MYLCFFTSPNVCHLGALLDYMCVCVFFLHKILSIYTIHTYNIIINSSVVRCSGKRSAGTLNITVCLVGRTTTS